jgi:peptidyl-tRNA hydrolase
MLNVRPEAIDETEAALERIVDAGKQVPRGAQALALVMAGALDELQDAVDEARSLGVDEAAIQDALGEWRVTATPVVATRVARRPRLRLVR